MHRTRRLLVALALIAVLTGTAVSRDRRPVPRVSPADKRKLDALSDRAAKEIQRRILAFEKALAKALDRGAAREIAAARKRVDGSADFAAFKKRRVAALRRPATRSAAPTTFAARAAAVDRRIAALTKLERSTGDLHALARLQAPLDAQAARRVIEQHLGLDGLIPRRDRTTGGTVVSSGDFPPPEEEEAPPPQTVFVFLPGDTGVSHRPAIEFGSTYEFADIDSDTGEFNLLVESIGNDVVAWAFAGMLPSFDVPPGYSELRITADFELSYRGTVAGAIPPSVASAYLSVSVYDTEDIFDAEIDGLTHLVMPVIGTMSDSGDSTGYKVVLEADLGGRSGAMRVSANAVVKAQASLWGHASARITGTVQRVTVEFIE